MWPGRYAIDMTEFTSIPFLFFFACALSCGIVCTWLFHTIRGEVNAKLPDQERIGSLFGYPGLLFKVEKIHRNLYPRSALRLVLNVFILLGFLCVVGIARVLHVL